jgi:hypothetical protein
LLAPLLSHTTHPKLPSHYHYPPRQPPTFLPNLRKPRSERLTKI